jgi:hypothetical protein
MVFDKSWICWKATCGRHREIARLDNTCENYREVSADVLLQSGGKSDLPWIAATVEKLSDVLPRVRIKQFSNLNHFGPNQTGAREVAEAVRMHFASQQGDPRR